MKNLIGTALALMALAVVSCAQPAGAPDRGAIEARNQAFMDAFAARNAPAIAAMYSADAVVMPDRAAAVEGAANVQAFWQAFMDSGAARLELSTDDIRGQGSSVVERGRFNVFDASGHSIGVGKYVVVWSRQGGEWMLTWDIWNTDAP